MKAFKILLHLALLPLAARADCTLTNLGLTPLPELGLKFYSGVSGGLYPNGANNRPPAHLAAGLNIAANQIQPLNSTGNADTNNGKIVLLSIGMSNTTQEWASKGTNHFKALADADPSKNPRVIILDGAQGGQDAPQWTNLNAATWNNVLSRLTSAGATTNQVQAIWLKEAIAGETGALTNHARLLQSYLETMVRNAKILYPNLKSVYVSSRTRAYVYGSGLNPEPYAYETAFAVKWIIEKQISGDASLNFDPAKGPVVAPYLSWGPYLWADGLVARSDGFTWLCSDLESDFTHPNATGAVPKVARQLLAFFKTDPTTTPWFLKKTVLGQPPVCAASANATNGIAPLTVNFSATASDVDGTIRDYQWTFDDGTFSTNATPTKNFPSPGNYTARVTVTDNNGNAVTRSLAINVTTTIADWKNAKFSSAELADPNISGDIANPDGDKFPNLLEYAMGFDPKKSDINVVTSAMENGQFVFTFPHCKAAADLSFGAEVSTNLVNWNAAAASEVIDNGPLETLVIREILPASFAKFFRLKATRLN